MELVLCHFCFILVAKVYTFWRKELRSHEEKDVDVGKGGELGRFYN